MDNTIRTVKPKVNRLPIVIGTMLVQIGVGTFYAWSIFNIAISKAMGIATYQNISDPAHPVAITAEVAKTLAAADVKTVASPSISFTFTLGCLALSLGTLIAGPLVKRFGIKLVCIVMGVLFGLAIISITTFGSNGSVPLFWALAGVVLGATDGIAYIATLSNAIKWFPERTGLISGISVACYGLGSFIFKYLDSVVGTGSLTGAITAPELGKTIVFWGIAAIIVIVLGSLLLKDAPAEPVQVAEKGSVDEGDKGNFSLAEMLHTPQAYLMFICLFTAAMFMGLLGSSVTALAANWSGMTAADAATMVAVVAIANTLGRFIMGSLSDIIGRKGVFFITYTLTLLSVIFLLFTKTPASMSQGMFYLVIIVLAFCFGGNITVFPTFVGDYFGLKNHTRNYSIIYQGFGFGALAVGFIIAGGNPLDPVKLTGLNAGGNFTGVLWTTLILLILSLIIFIVIRPPKKKI